MVLEATFQPKYLESFWKMSEKVGDSLLKGGALLLEIILCIYLLSVICVTTTNSFEQL